MMDQWQGNEHTCRSKRYFLLHCLYAQDLAQLAAAITGSTSSLGDDSVDQEDDYGVEEVEEDAGSPSPAARGSPAVTLDDLVDARVDMSDLLEDLNARQAEAAEKVGEVLSTRTGPSRVEMACCAFHGLVDRNQAGCAWS
jgi:hypothetical protein